MFYRMLNTIVILSIGICLDARALDADANDQKYCFATGWSIDRSECYSHSVSENRYYKLTTYGAVTTSWARTMNGYIIRGDRVCEGESTHGRLSSTCDTRIGQRLADGYSIRAVD